MTRSSPPSSTRLRTGLLGIGAAAAATALLSGILHWRAGAAVPAARIEPMPVAVTTYREQHAYQQQRQFLGLVEAGKRSDLGFESTGLLADIAVNEGSRVRAGDLLAQLDDRRLRAERSAAVAELATLQAELELARLKAQRQQDLQASGAVSQEAYDETRLRAQALASQQEATAAQLSRLDIELDKLALRAPYDGVVAARYLDPGAVIAPGAPVLRLIQSGAREAHVGVAPALASALNSGAHYPLRWRDREVMATLRAVRPDVDPATRSTVAVFELPPGIEALDGETVSLALSDTVETRGGWLPLSALLEGQRGVWNVLAIEEREGAAVTVRAVVEVLDVNGDQAFVRGTLADGQRVVADGIHRIAAGAAVTLLEP